MEFVHEFVVRGRPQDVILRFADVPMMTALVPGASVGERQEDGSYPATLVVSFGPKRIAFKGAVTNRVEAADLRGALEGRASADIRGARMSVAMNYQLSDASSAGVAATHVRLVSEAELSGVLGEFAKTGGTVVVDAMLNEFARRFSAEFGPKEAAPAPAAAHVACAAPVVPSAGPNAAASAPPAVPATLSAASLLMGVLRHGWRRLGRSIARLFGHQAPKT